MNDYTKPNSNIDNISHIRQQLGGFIGAISSTNDNLPKMSINYNKNNKNNKNNICNKGLKILFNINSWIILGILILYLLIGGVIFQSIESTTEIEIINTNYNLLSEIKSNISKIHYEKLVNLLDNDYKELYWNDLGNSIFFAFTLVSTIGYGNVTPQTISGKVFTVFYVFIGVPLGAYAFGSFASVTLKLFSWCTQLNSDIVLKAFKYANIKEDENLTPNQFKKIINAMGINVSDSELSDIIDDADINNDGIINFNEFKKSVRLRNWDVYNISQNKHQLLYVFLLLFTYLILGMIFFHFGEEWTLGDAFYFCVITITTIGLGDFYPKNHRFMVFIFSCVGLGLIALLVRFMCDIIVTVAKNKKILFRKKKIYNTNKLTNELILEQYYNNNPDIKIYRNSNIIMATKLNDSISIIIGDNIVNGYKDNWLIQWNCGNFFILDNDNFKNIYTKIKKRDTNDSTYRLKINLLCKKIKENDEIKFVETIEDNLKHIVEVKYGNYIVYDIVTENLKIINEVIFEKHYEIDNHKNINWKDLHNARNEIMKICKEELITL